MKSLVIILILSNFSLLISCSNTEHVASNSIIQKRKYRKGFHFKQLHKSPKTSKPNYTAQKKLNNSKAYKSTAVSNHINARKSIASKTIKILGKEAVIELKRHKVFADPIASFEKLSNHKHLNENSQLVLSRLSSNYLRTLKADKKESEKIRSYGSISFFSYLIALFLFVTGIVFVVLVAFSDFGPFFLFTGFTLVIIGGVIALLSIVTAIASIVQYLQNKSDATKRQLFFGLLALALIVLSVLTPLFLSFL